MGFDFLGNEAISGGPPWYRSNLSPTPPPTSPRALREELGIQVLPFPIAMGSQELQDGYDFTPEEFYPMLLAAAQIPTHAQLTPFVFSQCFQEAFQEGCRCLIYTAINAKGSATYQNAVAGPGGVL